MKRLMTLPDVSVRPSVKISKNTISATRAKIMPNWRVLPPKSFLSAFIVSVLVSGVFGLFWFVPKGQAVLRADVMSFMRLSWLASSLFSTPVMAPSKIV
ncbi:hypothetical protein SRABI128_06479 [Microbacterium sp. Bi128]|nr:hypothetical protein SRABI128_06479 [Microbacterium sp. Bi128]